MVGIISLGSSHLSPECSTAGIKVNPSPLHTISYLFAEMGVSLTGQNWDPPDPLDLHFPSSWDYRYAQKSRLIF
jgi:hypothetical protein